MSVLRNSIHERLTSFNFPLSISVGMTTAALITGNTVVVKPSSIAPLAVYEFYDLLVRAGLPPGAMNVVTGSGAEVGDHLVNHPKIAGIVFTGSKEVGFKLLRTNPRAWTIPMNSPAVKAAGVIHTDFEKKFIRAEVVNWKALIEHGGYPGVREKGLLKLEGKEYIVKDGDVLVIRHG